jgi:hypothetical protein
MLPGTPAITMMISKIDVPRLTIWLVGNETLTHLPWSPSAHESKGAAAADLELAVLEPSVTIRRQGMLWPHLTSADALTTWRSMSSTVTMAWEILDRMERAVGKVRDRLLRATAALNQAGIPYAVAGGHAIATWVTTVDEGAVRNTRDIDILVRREDLTGITAALEKAGFVRAEVLGVTTFLEGPDARPGESIHLLFAGEKVRPEHPLPAPSLSTIDDPAGFRVIALEALVHMKLSSNRDKDRTHVRDLVGVGLIDGSWLDKLPPALRERLQGILDTPDA